MDNKITEMEKAELIASLVSSLNKFTFNLYKELSSTLGGQNLFFSPASLSCALAMTYLGARNKTAEEMERVMYLEEVGVELEGLSVHELFRLLHESLGPGSNEFVLHSANRLYVHNEYSFLQPYIKASEYFYASDLEPVDFCGNTEGVRTNINNWVECMTNDKIRDLIPDGALSNLTRLIIVNAIYFKGDWKYQFDRSDTADAMFHPCKGSDNNPYPIKMMQQTGEFRYGYNAELKAKILDLPYAGNKMSMVIILPDSRHGLSNIESNMTPEIFEMLQKQFKMSKVKVNLKIPKFKIGSSFDLDETLPGLGMVELFDKGKSDLSGITRNNDLFVSKLVHKACLNLDEEGSEAVGSTAVVIANRSVNSKPAIEFNADHPFIFMIKDKTSGMILFMGKVTNPEFSDYCEDSPKNETWVPPEELPEIPEGDDRHITSLWVDPEAACATNVQFPLF